MHKSRRLTMVTAFAMDVTGEPWHVVYAHVAFRRIGGHTHVFWGGKVIGAIIGE